MHPVFDPLRREGEELAAVHGWAALGREVRAFTSAPERVFAVEPKTIWATRVAWIAFELAKRWDPGAAAVVSLLIPGADGAPETFGELFDYFDAMIEPAPETAIADYRPELAAPFDHLRFQVGIACDDWTWSVEHALQWLDTYHDKRPAAIERLVEARYGL